MRKLVSWMVLFAIYLGVVAPFAATGQVIRRTMETKLKDVPPGLQFRLSEGQSGAETRTTQPPAQTDPLSQAESGDLLKRLPPIKSETNDQTDFARRLGTLPPPKTGQRIPVKFPSEDDRGTPKISPGTSLEVIRYSPEGEVKLAPDLNVTFSQPMVAVTSQEQAAQYAPVELTPQVSGRWRWLGTKTLMFDTDKQFPMATKFIARIPAGTKAANGQVLAKDFTWTFTTPPPTVVRKYPEGQVVRRDALIYISFDQEIDPASVLSTTTVSAGGRKLRTRLATADEIASGPLGDAYKEQPGRWLILRVVNADGSVENAMPGASTITVTVEKGTHSAEGPLTTNAAQSFTFTTYGPMKFVNGRCGYNNSVKSCSPFADWYLEFNNPLDSTKFSKEQVKIEPPLDGLNIYPGGNYIYIQGYKKGRTTYKVTVDGSLADVFGQHLSQPATATFNVGSAEANLYSQGGTMAVLDPSAAPTFSVYSTNHSSVKVRVYAVTPSDWYQFQQYVRRINYDDDTQRPAIPGRLVIDRTESIKNIPDELVETRIDLSEALDGGYGNVIVDIQPTVKRDKNDRTRVFKWLQATQIGLDAFVDNSELVGFATELRTGKPLAGVDLSIYPNGNAVSQIRPTEPGMIKQAWDWLTGWGSDQADHIDALNSDGSVANSVDVDLAASNTTPADGILRLPLPTTASSKGQNVLIARRGKDVAFLPENPDYYWQDGGTWYKKPDADSLRWFVFDDRGIYKPNEEVSIKGYIRRVTGGKLGDVEGLNDLAPTVNYTVRDPRGNELGKGTAALNAFGAFDFKFKLPDNANLGYARVDLETASDLSSREYSHPFQIQEFRRPEFEVTAKVDSEAPFFVGDSALLSVEAKYYAGGGLPNAETNWTVTATPTNYTPPNRDDYVFGVWVPWWRIYDYLDYSGRGYYGGTTQTFRGVTDAAGKHVLKIDFQSVNPPRPYAISASASVQDVNRQTWAGQASLLVHPSSLYVGIKTPRTFVQKGESINVESIVTDIDGKIITGRDVEIKAVLKDWEFDKGSWQEKTVDEQTCSVKSTDQPQPCSFIAKQGGRYIITATVMDDRERYNQSELTVWIPGGKTPPSRNVEQQQVQIIPSKKEYAPGETAELLVIAPFTPAEGVLTLRRDGIVRTERFTMKDSSATLKIPIEENYLPNIYAQVDLVGSAPRTNDKGEIDAKLTPRPAFASGNINLNVSTASRRLNVSAEPLDKTLVPGGETKVDIAVKDSNGNAVSNSEVAVVVVDESVLALTRYSIADPMSIFYTDRPPATLDYHSRSQILLANPGDLKVLNEQAVGGGMAETVSVDGIATRQMQNMPASAPMAAAKIRSLSRKDAEEAESQFAQQNGINLRENFSALALFAPSVRTDADGRAVVNIKLPDNLTRYRITAVSVDDAKRFGKADSTITAKQPLMVRPSAPRFMNFGDRIDLPVVVQNQTDQDMAVDVAIRATNSALMTSGDLSEPGAIATWDLKSPPAAASDSDTMSRRVLVKANDRAEVRFPIAAVKAGTARFQIAVSSGKFSDAAEISLPVWTPATAEAFATYGTTDQNGAILQPIQTPADVFPQFGGLEVTTSSTQLQELTDAFLQLYHYPFECSEQISSRMISVAALRDVLTAFKSKDMPASDEINASFAKDIAILKARQRDDGSFGLWTRERERYEYPFLTVHVAHALILAKMKGYNVPDEMLNKTKPYLKNVESHFDEWYKNAPQVRWTISAYALYVRDLMGDKDIGKAKKLLAEMASADPELAARVFPQSASPDTQLRAPFEALGWILSVLANDSASKTETDAIVRFLMNRTTETAATANFVTDYGDGAWLIMYSNRRADGVLLEALIKADPNNDLIPKLVRGLLDHRVKGAWGSTQENVFILLALDKYFNTFEKVTPDFVTRIWLGTAYAGEQKFGGRSIDSNALDIPMSYLTEQSGDTSDLIIDKQGPGRLYYRIGMKYAPKNLKLDPADYGFTVLRGYEPIDNADDVKQNANGSWTIKSGARVRVRITMVAQARRYHVALVDNLPAGLEILNPGLATTEAIPADAQPATSVLTYGSRSIGGGWWWWRQYWFEHQNFRDERAEAFASLLWEGVYNYSYVARATTPGQFVVPPAKAEEMYHPETFGRTGTDFVNIQ